VKVLGSMCALILALCYSSEAQPFSQLDQIDQQLASNRRQQILSSGLALKDPAIESQISRIVENLSKTSFNRGYAFPTQFTYVEDDTVNAASGGAGQIYVFSGLVRAVHANDGVMAFAIGHEMAHNRLQHRAKTALRYQEFNLAYRQMYVQNPNSAELYKIAWQITEKKIERNEETQADQLGVRMAAEAGYHPDYAILASRALRGAVGESSKFMAFFSDHPRWTTREERTERNYAEAMDIFNRSWPNAALSPGGVPPSIAVVSPIRINKQKSLTTASAQVEIRHLNGKPAVLAARLIAEGNVNARTLFTRQYRGDQDVSEPLSFNIPSDLLIRHGKKDSLAIEISEGADVLYNSGLVGLRSSHKTSNNSKSLKASTSNAAEVVLAKAVPRYQGDQQIAGLRAPDLKSVSAKSSNALLPGAAPSSETNTVPSAVSLAPANTSSSKISVVSNPSGAEVYVNGSSVGLTPLTITFVPSSLGFNLSVEKDGYGAWYVQTFAVPGVQQFNAELHPVQ
jgi:hypothetical protein